MNTKIIFNLLVAGCFWVGVVQAETKIQGVAYYSSAPGLAPKIYVCKKIEPVNGFIMPVELEDGAKMSMDIRAIYALIDYNKLGLSEITNRKDAGKLQGDIERLEKMAKEFPPIEPWAKPKAKELEDEIARFEKGHRKEKGQWLTADQLRAQVESAKAKEELAKITELAASSSATLGTVTTKQGKSYSNFEVTRVDDDGVAIRFASGVARIAFKDLPEDLSGFPESKRAEIQEKKDAWKASEPAPEPKGESSVAEKEPKA